VPAAEPANGYGITRAVAAMSGNRVKLRPGGPGTANA
jgi:hypothetical protein